MNIRVCAVLAFLVIFPVVAMNQENESPNKRDCLEGQKNEKNIINNISFRQYKKQFREYIRFVDKLARKYRIGLEKVKGKKTTTYWEFNRDEMLDLINESNDYRDPFLFSNMHNFLEIFKQDLRYSKCECTATLGMIDSMMKNIEIGLRFFPPSVAELPCGYDEYPNVFTFELE